MDETKPVDNSNGVITIDSELCDVSTLKIREFVQEDSKKVRAICNKHVRSTSFAAMSYYTASHIEDLLFLTTLALIFLDLRRVLICIVAFNIYLFSKSRFEAEQYILKHCNDLHDIKGYYQQRNDGSNFWVAEITRKSTNTPMIVGCIGLIVQDQHTGKIVRLTVASKFRRMKIGTYLLKNAEDVAKKKGLAELFLFTNTLNLGHANFVTQHSYQLLSTIPRGLMRGDLLFWKKSLKDPSSRNKNEDLTEMMGGNVLHSSL